MIWVYFYVNVESGFMSVKYIFIHTLLLLYIIDYKLLNVLKHILAGSVTTVVLSLNNRPLIYSHSTASNRTVRYKRENRERKQLPTCPTVQKLQLNRNQAHI